MNVNRSCDEARGLSEALRTDFFYQKKVPSKLSIILNSMGFPASMVLGLTVGMSLDGPLSMLIRSSETTLVMSSFPVRFLVSRSP